MSKILEGLKRYFDENSPEQIKKDWSDFDKYNKIGISVDSFLEHQKLPVTELNNSYKYIYAAQIIENPEFTSDFLV